QAGVGMMSVTKFIEYPQKIVPMAISLYWMITTWLDVGNARPGSTWLGGVTALWVLLFLVQLKLCDDVVPLADHMKIELAGGQPPELPRGPLKRLITHQYGHHPHLVAEDPQERSALYHPETFESGMYSLPGEFAPGERPQEIPGYLPGGGAREEQYREEAREYELTAEMFGDHGYSEEFPSDKTALEDEYDYKPLILPEPAEVPTQAAPQQQRHAAETSVPKLEESIQKALKSCKAVAESEAEWEQLVSKAKVFGEKGGIGEKLPDQAWRGNEDWISEWWDQGAYMTYRDSVVVNVSYLLWFQAPSPKRLPQRRSSARERPAYVAASITSTALEFRRLVSQGLLEPETIGNNPLCTGVVQWAYNACRVPAKPADYAVKIPEEAPEGQFMIAIRRNRFWKVALRDASGKEFGVHEFKNGRGRHFDGHQPRYVDRGSALPVFSNHALQTANKKPSQVGAYSLDGEPHKSRDAPSDPRLGVSSLPSTMPRRLPSTDEGIRDLSVKLWKASEGGSEWRSGEQVVWIVFSNGEAGFIGEHSCMDGTPTARMNDFITRRLLTDAPSPIGPEPHCDVEPPTPTYLSFELDDTSKAHISKAKKEFASHVGQYDVHYKRYTRYGKGGIKKMKISPDGWFVGNLLRCTSLSLILDEAAQTRRFQLGRTETIRTATVESAAFTKAMLDPQSTPEKRRELFSQAVKVQGADVRAASAGLGIDRHFFGLRHLIKPGEETEAEFLKDPLLARSSHWNMSTSQIYIASAPSYGWGPVVSDGYGLPYMIHEDNLQFTVTCHQSMPGEQFLRNLEKAGDMIMEMEGAASRSEL
ncbi:acyltransferase ChoActase/COT/CPT, partial [Pseudohyphozyma bogoriensis]